MIWRALGAVPGPIIFGALFDASCEYWQEECDDRGNCWVYDNKSLSLRIFGLTTGIRIVAVLLSLCVWLFFNVTLCNRGKIQAADETEMKTHNGSKLPEAVNIEFDTL